jgi:phosphoserine aminotransferase
MSIRRIYNFSAGPACLPLPVLIKVKEDFMEHGGMSIFEISHRSKGFMDICEDAKARISSLLGLDASFEVLFLAGGAAQQFAMVPMNLMDRAADYAVTGRWAKRAWEEAGNIGEARVAFSSEDSLFSRVPRPGEISLSEGTSYLHITSNNTAYGTQYREFPETGGVPLVADMSSDILSRRIDARRFGLIYASAQKNMGPAGVTVVIIRRDLLGRSYRKLPNIFRYKTHADAGSIYNTPPVFAIYMLRMIVQWIEGEGGVAEMEGRAKARADVVYGALGEDDFYELLADRESRSMMNVTFRLQSDALTERFLREARALGMEGLSGHRTVGGIRASMYDAFPLEGASALAEFIRRFRRTA